MTVALFVLVFCRLLSTEPILNSGPAFFYIYWEPTNADDLEEYVNQRKEVVYLTGAVGNSQISFIARSYSQLWDEWRNKSNCDGMNTHLLNLAQRYSFSI